MSEHDLTARLFYHRVVVLGDELDQQGGNRLVAQLLTLAADDPKRDIRFWINSPGGSVPAMLAIMDVMRAIPNDVSVVDTRLRKVVATIKVGTGPWGLAFGR